MTKAAGSRQVVDPAAGIGANVARLRSERDIKVSALARQVGVSPSLISQIERGQSRPSVTTLFALAEALEVPVDAFFARDAASGPSASELVEDAGRTEIDDESGAEPMHGHRHLVRRSERAAIDIEGGVRWELLTPELLDNVEFLELVYGPRAQSHETLYRHPGTEMVLLLSGRLDIYVGFERHELEPGDSIQFPSSYPHRYVNPMDEEARAVTVILHDGAEPAGSPTQRRP